MISFCNTAKMSSYSCCFCFVFCIIAAQNASGEFYSTYFFEGWDLPSYEEVSFEPASSKQMSTEQRSLEQVSPEQASPEQMSAEQRSPEEVSDEEPDDQVNTNQESPEQEASEQLQSEQVSSDQSSTVCLQEHNYYRRQARRPDLAGDSNLVAAARAHNDVMVNNNCFEHHCAWESELSGRVSQAGYSWSGVGENIAAGQSDCDGVMDTWMNSGGHRANILGNFEHVGCVFGYCNDCQYNIYWTCVFGNPA